MAGEETMSGGENSQKILVSVRTRPLNDKEKERNDICDWECINNTTIVCNNNFPERSLFPSAYSFDRVFGFECPTKQVYEEGAKEVVLCVLTGINSSIFAYGQTSSGKTYTMTGITKFAMDDIFDYIDKHKERKFTLRFSAIEIYNEAVRDLLSSDNTPLRLLDDPERGTVVEKLREETLRDRNHLEELLSICETQRKIGETSLNETSSRSHQILRLMIESSGCEFSPGNASTLAASVCFVDLAGSERASQTLSAGARLKEGCHINRSLLTLGTVVRKLSKGKNGHVPYRDSKLTRILQNSLGGNAKTAIICTLSPARSHVEQSRNTLLFASCAKEVTTNAQVNLVVSEKALVKQLQRELARMENELRNLGSGSASSGFYSVLKHKEELIEKMEHQIKELTWQRDLAQSRVANLLKTRSEDRSLRTDENSVASSIDAGNPFVLEADLRRKSNDSRGFIEHSMHSNLGKCNGLNLFKNAEENYFLLDDSDPQFSGKLGKDREEIARRTLRERSETEETRGSSHAVVDKKAVFEVPSQRKEETLSATPPREYEEHEISSSNAKFEGSDQTLKNLDKEMSLIIDAEKEEEISVFSEQPRRLSSKETEEHSLFSMRTEQYWEKEEYIDSSTYEALTETMKELQKTIEFLMSTHAVEQQQSPSLESEYSSPGHDKLKRSRSCREILPNARSSCWTESSEHKKSASPAPFPRDFDTESTISSTSFDAQSVRDSHADDTSSFREFIAGLNEMTKQQHHHQPATATLELGSGNANPRNVDTMSIYRAQNPRDRNVENTNVTRHQTKIDGSAAKETDSVEKNTKNTTNLGKLRPAKGPYSSGPSDFERQQRRIIELWAACNVPLAHRTYFFLLFKGDPSDFVYMEVELRRLSFLKASESHESDPSRRQSAKALTREKEWLAKQIPKKFTQSEKEELYRKWGVELNKKRRSLQVAQSLWSKTRDTEHVKASASLVAELVGFMEPSQTPKEMFGLAFSSGMAINTKSSGWRFAKSFSLV